MWTSLAYMLGGTDLPPDFDGLKGKKVLVVCRPVAGLDYRNARADQDLAKQVGALLQSKVQKITVIDQQKVAKRLDENPTEDYPAIGRALKAEMVVAVEMNSFSTVEGPTLWRGQSELTIKVYDLGKEKKGAVVWEKALPASVYPPSCGIPMSDQSEREFRKTFITVLADQVARHFYYHDSHADIGLDTKALD
jgi:hypothetical protein